MPALFLDWSRGVGTRSVCLRIESMKSSGQYLTYFLSYSAPVYTRLLCSIFCFVDLLTGLNLTASTHMIIPDIKGDVRCQVK